MHTSSTLQGVFAAAVTPLQMDGAPDVESIPRFLAHLAGRGCHGALLLGTTGEGTSFSPGERFEILRTACRVREAYPDFRLMAGTGTPSLQETIDLTQAAFQLGMDGVVVLPPYFYRKVSDDGLFTWFSRIITESVPPGKVLLGYHIPSITGVSLSLDLLARLKDAYPDRFAGIKDSSADPEQARKLGQRFGKDLLVFSGNDPLFSLALENEASGCITALANLYSPDLRAIWEAHQKGNVDANAQERLLAARSVLDRHPPAPPLIKAILTRQSGFPSWTVRPPLLPLSPELEDQVATEFNV